MKELSVEEKAKRYDEAIKKLHEIITMDNKPVIPKEIGEYLFPELKESEDERIRKELLQIAKESEDSFYMVMTPNKRERLIAWLEKQGEQKTNPCDGCINRNGCINCENGELRETEQKPADKVEAKYKCEECKDILEFIDSLEVKEVEEVPYIISKTGKFTTTTK